MVTTPLGFFTQIRFLIMSEADDYNFYEFHVTVREVFAGLCVNNKQKLPWPNGTQGRPDISCFPIYCSSICFDRLRYRSQGVLAVGYKNHKSVGYFVPYHRRSNGRTEKHNGSCWLD
jgi:hypothetical protein